MLGTLDDSSIYATKPSSSCGIVASVADVAWYLVSALHWRFGTTTTQRLSSSTLPCHNFSSLRAFPAPSMGDIHVWSVSRCPLSLTSSLLTSPSFPFLSSNMKCSYMASVKCNCYVHPQATTFVTFILYLDRNLGPLSSDLPCLSWI